MSTPPHRRGADVLAWLVRKDADARVARLLFVALWLTFAFFGSTPSWNPNSRFDLTRAIAERGTFQIDAFHTNTGDKSVYNGHYFSDKAPGVSFLAVPIHFLAFQLRLPRAEETPEDVTRWASRALYLSTVLTIGLLSALTGVLLFWILRRFNTSARRSLLITLAYSLGTPALAYSSLFFGHQAAAAFSWAAFAVIVLPRAPLRPFHFASIGLLGGLAIACEYPAVVTAVVLVVLVLLEQARTPGQAARQMGWIILGALVPLGGLLAYHTVCFGAPWRIGYAALVPSRFSTGMSGGFFGIGWPTVEGWWGITFGRLRGLFVVSPVLLLAVGGLVWGTRRSQHLSEHRAALIIVFCFFLLNASYVFWNGGASYGPRHVVPMLPFLALGLATLPTTNRRLTIGMLILAIVSVLNAIAAATVGADLPEYGHVLLDHVWPAILENRVPSEPFAYNLGLVLGLPGVWSLLPLAVFWLFVGPLLVSLTPTDPHP